MKTNRRNLLAWTLSLVFTGLLQAQPAPTTAPALPGVDGAFHPAAVYFGTYNYNDQLVDHPDQWTFVQQHMDGSLLHFGFWLNNDKKVLDNLDIGRRYGAILSPLGKKYMLEVGWPGSAYRAASAGDMGHFFAGQHAEKIKAFQSATGIHIDHVESELRLFVLKQIAEKFPAFSSEEVLTKLIDSFWPDYVTQMKAELDNVPVSMGCPPLYVPWEQIPALGKDFTFKHPAEVTADGKPKADARTMRFDGKPLFEGIYAADTAGFTCDSPYYLMSDPRLVQSGYLAKIVGINRWVQQHGKLFSFIVNAPPKDKSLSADEWDRRYAEDSLKSLQLFQLSGGRADRYLIESWYAGPYQLVPEDRPGTFTNLVKNCILFLKGPGQTLALSAMPARHSRTTQLSVKVTNTGTIACLPAIRLRATGGSTANIAGAEALFSDEGVAAKELLGPGASITMDFPISAAKTASLECQVMWNPQDPSNTPRATATVVLHPEDKH